MKVIYDLKTQKVTLDITQDELLSTPRKAIDEAMMVFDGIVWRLKLHGVAVKRVVKNIGGRR